MTRDKAWWADHLEDRTTQRGNGSALHYTIHPDGFLTYRVVGSRQHAFRPPLGTVVVEDFCPITDEAHTELLQTLLVLEMFYRVEIDVPPDDPLPLKLVDQCAAETKGISDFLWERINDVPEVLGPRLRRRHRHRARRHRPAGAGRGRFQLQTRDGAGKCTPHDEPADLEIGLADLATVYMGAHRGAQLARAKRVTELRQGALGRLDAAFGAERAPFCGTVLSDRSTIAQKALAASLFRWFDGCRPGRVGESRPRPPAKRLSWVMVRDFAPRQNACYCRLRGLGRPQAPLAQLVEQLTLNQRVRGSKP